MTTDDTTNTTTATETVESAPELPKLTSEQEISALRSVHQFLAEYDRVPGSLASKWSQALDTIAVVANSLIGKAQERGELSPPTAAADANDSVTQ